MSTLRNSATWLLLPLAAASCARPAPPPPDSVVVRVVHVQGADGSSTFRASGDVHARIESNLSFRVGGKVTARLVDTGDHVRPGTVLARLDPEGPRADVAVASAALASARATLENAKTNLQRQRALYAQVATSKSNLDDAERDASMAASGLLAAQARFEIARDALSYTELKASHAGIVTARAIEAGQVAQQGATAFTLADDGPRDAVFRIDESIANRIEKGTPLSIELIDDVRITAAGHVREISPAVEQGTASVRIKVALDGTLPAEMTLGSPVVGSLLLKATSAFTVPASAIFSDANEAPSVWILDPKTRAVSLRPVAVEAYESGSVTLKDGIHEGDVIVTDGSGRLRPSQVVTLADGEHS